MKKLLFTLALMAILMTACSSTLQDTSIKPSKFSEEKTKVLTLLDDVQFFDITLDEGIKSYTMSVWVYCNGEWVENGSTEHMLRACRCKYLNFAVCLY